MNGDPGLAGSMLQNMVIAGIDRHAESVVVEKQARGGAGRRPPVSGALADARGSGDTSPWEAGLGRSLRVSGPLGAVTTQFYVQGTIRGLRLVHDACPPLGLRPR
jgi:hypothetical protein